MWLALALVAVVLIGGAVLSAVFTYSRRLSPVDLERLADARRAHARSEIQAIEIATVRLMRAAVACSGKPSRSRAGETRRDAAVTAAYVGGAAGFAWSPDPVASSSSAAGSVTFFASNTWRRS